MGQEVELLAPKVPLEKKLENLRAELRKQTPSASETEEFKLEASRLLAQLDESQLIKGWSGMVARLKRETNFLKGLEEVGLDLENLTPEGEVVVPIALEYHPRALPQAAATYQESEQRITVYSRPVKIKQLWQDLAGTGQIPLGVMEVVHELAHHTQTTRLFRFLGLGNLPLGVREAHAHLLSTLYDLDEEHYLKTVADQAKRSVEVYCLLTTKKGTFRDRRIIGEKSFVLPAIQTIRELKALGFSSEKIFVILRKYGRYGTKNPFGEVRQFVTQEREKRGLTEKELHEQTLISELKQEGERLKAWQIAREELARL